MSYRPNYSAHPSIMDTAAAVRHAINVPPGLNEYLHFGETCTGSPIHTKDGELFSVNYLHAGAVKIWYFIEWVVTWSIRCPYWRNVIYTVSHWLGFAPPLMCRAWMDIYTCISARPAMGHLFPPVHQPNVQVSWSFDQHAEIRVFGSARVKPKEIHHECVLDGRWRNSTETHSDTAGVHRERVLPRRYCNSTWTLRFRARRVPSGLYKTPIPYIIINLWCIIMSDLRLGPLHFPTFNSVIIPIYFFLARLVRVHLLSRKDGELFSFIYLYMPVLSRSDISSSGRLPDLVDTLPM